MPEVTRQRKITFGEMRESGVCGLLIYCADYKCSRSIAISADRWPDDVRLSDIEPLFICQACGKRAPKFGGASRPPGWARANEMPKAAVPRACPRPDGAVE